jgi:predicted permease
LKLRLAWRLSKYPYIEFAFRSILLSRGGNLRTGGFGRQDPQRIVKSTIRSVTISKAVFTLFVCLGNVLPFTGLLFSRTAVSLVSAIALSLAISLAYIIIYSLQVLPYLTSAGPYSLLQTLPLSQNDFSLVAMLSFLRTFDFPAIGAIITPVALVALWTRSLIATGLMLAGAILNIVFAVAISLWFSGVFYRNMTRGGRSRSGSILRGVFLVTWGVATLSTYFIFNFLTQLLPYVDSIITGNLSQPIGLLLTILHPFAISLTIASIVYPNLFTASVSSGDALLFTGLNYASSALYVLLALVVARRTLHTISSITHGEGVKIVRDAVKDFTLRLRKPLFAYVTKDLRISSKNPSTAILFALPVFEIVIILLSFRGLAGVGGIETISATLLGAFFTLTGATALLNTERTGLEFTMSMPIRSQTIIQAKSLIATLIYVPVPFLILGLAVLTHSSLIVSPIPFLEIIAVSAATTAEIAVFVNTQKKPSRSGRGAGSQTTGFSLMSGSSLLTLFAAFITALVIIAVPVGAYSIIVFLTSSESESLIVMALTAASELLIVQALVRLFR